MNTFTIIYEPRVFGGEQGYWYEVRCRGRIVGEGWSLGKKHHAEQMAKSDVHKLERRAA